MRDLFYKLKEFMVKLKELTVKLREFSGKLKECAVGILSLVDVEKIFLTYNVENI